MKKFSLSFALFVASAAYVAYQYIAGSNTVSTVQTVTSQPVQSPPKTIVSTPASTLSFPTTTVPPKNPQGQYSDGTYTGSAADAYYGIVQVQALIQGGQLTDVSFLQYPNDRRASQHINGIAMPRLRQEAIQAQSANVSGVSSASYTSAAFRESLASALARAKN